VKTACAKPAEPDPRATETAPRGVRIQAPVRWVLRFGLRTVFVLLLLICLALAAAYYGYFRTRSALAGPTLHLLADDTVSLSRVAGQPLSADSLSGMLNRAMKRYRIAVGETGDKVRRYGWADWENPYGPPVTVVAHPQATHGALDALLHAGVDEGFERYVLVDATNREHSFSFVLVEDLPREGLPDPCKLPPFRLTLRAAEDGSLHSLLANTRQLQDLAELRKLMINVIGPERGPNSIHASIEVEMRCDANLKVRHVFDVHKTLAGYITKDGKWVSLVERMRPVDWGDGEFEIDVMEEMIEIESEDIRDPEASEE
jgi:hypothetical protein